MTDSKGHKVIVCDNGTGVSGLKISAEWRRSYSVLPVCCFELKKLTRGECGVLDVSTGSL